MGDDMHLIGVMRAVHQLKLIVPDDISIISISHGFIPTLYDPKITYVETSGFKLGKLAFAQMLSPVSETMPRRNRLPWRQCSLRAAPCNTDYTDYGFYTDDRDYGDCRNATGQTGETRT